MNSTSNISDLADKDKTNFIAAFFQHIDIIFSIISIWIFFEENKPQIAGIALTLLLLERLFQFFHSGIKTYKWSQAIMGLVFLDYFAQMCKSEEGRGMKLYKKRYTRVLMISSPFSVFCFFGFFEGSQHQSLLLACGIIHLLNTSQTNLEYYTQNILSIKAMQKIYIYTFVSCEFFYRLVFLSFFKSMIEGEGMIGYQIGEFFLNFFFELIICKREGQEKSFWFFSTLQKAWSGAFYFRLEDTMVQDADEWTPETRNLDNYRQQLRISNVFKSSRSKLFIWLRFLENMFLTIVGIIQFSKQKENDGLFALVIILLPFYLIWHIKYCRFKFQNDQLPRSNNNLNDSAVPVPVKSTFNKYKDDIHMKQCNSEQSQNNGIRNTPESKKYNNNNNNNNQDVFNQYPSENTYQSDQKKFKKLEDRVFQHSEATPPIASQKHQRQASRNTFNQNIGHEDVQLNEMEQQLGELKKEVQQQHQQQEFHGVPKKFSSNNSQYQNKKENQKQEKLKNNQHEHEEDDDDDNPFGEADINAFAIE